MSIEKSEKEEQEEVCTIGKVRKMNIEQTEIYFTEYIPYSVPPNDISDQCWQEREYAIVPRYRINEKTGKVVQVHKITLLLKYKKIVWIDYETSILSTRLGKCPKCGTTMFRIMPNKK